jgi:hypothetical protein
MIFPVFDDYIKFDRQVYQHLQYSSVSIFSLNWLKSGLLLTDIALYSQTVSCHENWRGQVLSEILANQPTTVWGHYQRMEIMLPIQVVVRP